jgi:predicted AAA+ superfamily ATPase
MPHTRKRLLSDVILKRMKLWPCLNLLGVRQCGKSTLVRDVLWQKNKFSYATLDKASERREANSSPALFLSKFEVFPVVIDEAHKAPDLFDEIKSEIDENRVPGKYVLTGSVKFGLKVGIRESLTGRSATLRMEPMSIIETLELTDGKSHSIRLNSVRKHLDLGGMPGVCFLRNDQERESYWNEWLETTCERDLKQFSKGKLSSELALQILEELAVSEFPEAQDIAKRVGTDRRRVQNHLEALMELFVVREVQPHLTSGSGKPMYFLFDPGLVHHFKGNLRKKWQSWFLLESSIKNSLSNEKAMAVKYYKSRAGLFADFVTKDYVHFFSDKVGLDHGLKIRAENARKKLKLDSAITHQPFESNQQVKKSAPIITASWCDLNNYL